MSAFSGSESEIAMLAERLIEETRGRYKIQGRQVAGDGYVEFDGVHSALGRPVTLRVVPRPPSGPSRDRVMAVVRLEHPHLQPVHDFFEVGDTLVVVVPRVDASNLWWTTRTVDGVSWAASRWFETVLRLVREVAAGLAHAHGNGVVHGRLRPECIVVDGGSAVVGGFLTADTSGEWSSFESPEQEFGKGASPAADQYALGVMAYQLLTGEPPFADAEGQKRGASRTSLAGLPRGPVDAIMRMMAHSADDRFGSMDDVMLALAENIAPPPTATDALGGLDENVQFTVYRPSVVKPGRWYPMLAFAHLSEAREGSDEPDPVAVVEKQAKQILEDAIADYKQITEDASQAIPREGTITFVPDIDGVEFNPPRQSFEWVESVHRVEFRLRAAPALDGKTARGRLTVYHGVIILAELTLSIKVDSAPRTAPARSEPPLKARPYRKIFASYSHKDMDIVHQFERFAVTLGDSYLRDSRDIRAGEVWSDRLEELMREADIVQLFWSWNAMASPFVRREWEYALSLGRPNFIRPTYWEDPMPAAPDGSLPTPELLRLQFQRIAASRAEFKQKFGHSGITGESAIPSAPRVSRMSAPPPPSADVTLSASPPKRSRSVTRVVASIGALAFVGMVMLTTIRSTDTVPNTASSPTPVGPPPVAVVPSPDSSAIAPGARGEIPTKGIPSPPVTRPTTEAPPPIRATLREVTEAYRIAGDSARKTFERQAVVVEPSDSASVLFARNADQAFLRTDSTAFRQLVCRVIAQSGRLLARDCRRERRRG